MRNRTIIVSRLQDTGFNTLSNVGIFGRGMTPMMFPSLELPWRDNEIRVSCIPPGRYRGVVRYSEKYGRHIHITGVPNRSLILFHWGNFTRDTQGCILVGSSFGDIDGDGKMDVTASKKAFGKFMSFFEDSDEIWVEITPAILTP